MIREIAATGIVGLLGWESRFHELWDTHTNRPTEFFDQGSFKHPRFEPFLVLDDALYAASRLSDLRECRFALTRDPHSRWFASFDTSRGAAAGEHAMPERAICKAIYKLGETPDRFSLFGDSACRSPQG